jgi:hypothetical protein
MKGGCEHIEKAVAVSRKWVVFQLNAWARLTSPYHATSGCYEMLRKGKVVPVLFILTEHHAIKAYWGSGGIDLRILDLGTRWRRVVSFTPRPLYPQRKEPLVPIG